MSREISCRYFDGVSPKPILGKLFFKENFLEFIGESESYGEIRIPIYGKDIIDLSKESNGTHRLVYSPPKNPNFHSTFFLEDSPDVQYIYNYRLNVSVGTLKKIDIAIGNSHKKFFGYALVALLFLGLSFYYIIENVYKIIPISVDSKIGKLVSDSILANEKVCSDKSLEKFLNLYGKKFFHKGAEFKVKILNNPIANAISLPNGEIFFFSGLLENSESPEEVLGVLAHEVAHVENRHGIRNIIKAIGLSIFFSFLVGGTDTIPIVETMSEVSNTLLAYKYSRDFEREADKVAITILNRNKISAKGLGEFFERVSNEKEEGFALLSTHPASPERMEYIKNALKNEKFKPEKIILNKAWKSIRKNCMNEKKDSLE
ncbi:MAG: M48 family metallopeptidase [Leptospiraceae bacterium]|nr:M48 family metallopeptidase [Leptospiraceae bacterium]